MAEFLAKEPLFNGKTEFDQLDKVDSDKSMSFIYLFAFSVIVLIFVNITCRYLELSALQMRRYGQGLQSYLASKLILLGNRKYLFYPPCDSSLTFFFEFE